jgi:hypothetical protein
MLFLGVLYVYTAYCYVYYGKNYLNSAVNPIRTDPKLNAELNTNLYTGITGTNLKVGSRFEFFFFFEKPDLDLTSDKNFFLHSQNVAD